MKKRFLLICSALLLTLAVWTVWSNTALEVNEYSITSGKLPDAFDGFRIAQISDLHNAEFGEDNQHLLALLRQSCPDLIVITGDLVDSYQADLKTAL